MVTLSRRVSAVGAGIVLGLSLVAAPAPASAAGATTSVPARSGAVASDSARATKVSAKKLLRKLNVRRERRKGYSRSKFTHWIEQGGGCDTRAVVLKDESKVRTTQNRYCTIKRGKWKSEYDGTVVRRAKKLDIDHRVPLAEAWDSGAKKWNKSTRKRFANDLGYNQSLVAVTASSNRSKSDGDIADWLPKKQRCKYTARYVAVKWRWKLSVDRTEKRAIKRTFNNCSNRSIKLAKPSRAKVRTGGGSSGGGGGGGGLDPRFDTCTEAIDHGYGPYYQGSDPEYDWYDDRDNDGIVCE